ncbi:M20 family metallo-hydrolase [Vaginella massiliensis]|uniref:M20 family metallo-hydrolase n=1 Tax=Vaginella massiliensis TaxID=1816680 RepID=UPI0008396BC1|nr:M20 family metallo-hydrolase [Vaginella massiliensis]
MLSQNDVKHKAVALLKEMIQLESFSGSEEKTADLLFNFLVENGAEVHRQNNNVYSFHSKMDANKKTILLNSHHDTVKPGSTWTYDPFGATLEGDKLIGLGSNDAGASAVSLLATFLYLLDKPLAYNLIVAITAEEENSGKLNVASLLPHLPPIDLGIVGEPTQMDMAIAERGLIVYDIITKGKTGHAAREEGINAIYIANDFISKLRAFEFDKVSEFMGPVKMTITQIEAGKQHNVVPDECKMVMDVRVNEFYSNEEVNDCLQKQFSSPEIELLPRSLRLNSSRIAENHPIVEKGIELGCTTYGSPTLSDQSMMNFTTVKIGPGDSARSHTPDEYIYISEIHHGIERYIELLEDFKF